MNVARYRYETVAGLTICTSCGHMGEAPHVCGALGNRRIHRVSLDSSVWSMATWTPRLDGELCLRLRRTGAYFTYQVVPRYHVILALMGVNPITGRDYDGSFGSAIAGLVHKTSIEGITAAGYTYATGRRQY